MKLAPESAVSILCRKSLSPSWRNSGDVVIFERRVPGDPKANSSLTIELLFIVSLLFSEFGEMLGPQFGIKSPWPFWLA